MIIHVYCIYKSKSFIDLKYIWLSNLRTENETTAILGTVLPEIFYDEAPKTAPIPLKSAQNSANSLKKRPISSEIFQNSD